jgi:hypothetical protein
VDQDAAALLRSATAGAAAAAVTAARGQEAAARDGSSADAGVLQQLASRETQAVARLVHFVTPLFHYPNIGMRDSVNIKSPEDGVNG